MRKKRGGEVRILHLSDLHHGGPKNADEAIVLDALFKSLAQQVVDYGNIDLVIFSGDLVHHGSDQKLFLSVEKLFIERLTSVLNIELDRIVICPGNHDINRDVVRKSAWVDKGISADLTSRGSINSFIDSQMLSYTPRNIEPPFDRLRLFFKNIWQRNNSSMILASPFLQVYNYSIAGTNVGVASFNTAWRTSGEPDDVDYGRLVLGERVVDLAAKALTEAKAELKFAVFHHPLNWMSDADQSSVLGRLETEFDVLFSGHVHRADPVLRQTLSGEAVHSQGACLYASREYFNGYTILDFGEGGDHVTFNLMEYSDKRRDFIAASRLTNGGSVIYPLPSKGAGGAVTLGQVMPRVRSKIKALANSHLSLTGADGPSVDIEHHFVPPPLTESSSSVSHLADVSGRSATERTAEIKDLIQQVGNICLVGRPESGKTSIAHYIAYLTSIGHCDVPRLPLLCRFNDLAKGSTPLWRISRSYAIELSQHMLTRSAVEKLPVLYIVDDVDVYDAERIKLLQTVIEATPTARWVLLVDSPAITINPETAIEKLFPDFKTLAIKELPRAAIRTLSATWLGAGGDTEHVDEMYRSVMEHIQRAGLPRSGYIVSLLIWALQHKSKGELLNEAVLLQNIIDYMLGRMDYRGALRAEFDFTSKTAVLQNLAFHFKIAGPIGSKNSVVAAVIAYLGQKGLRYDGSAIVDGLIACGILVEVHTDVSFRYSRFQDFFVAGYLRDHPMKLADVVQDDLLGYGRELDILTARFRHEGQLLDSVRSQLAAIDVPLPVLEGPALESYMSSGPEFDYALHQIKRMRDEPMTGEKIDRLLDEADKNYLKFRSERENDPERHSDEDDRVAGVKVIRYVQTLEVYSQMVRNLEFVDRDVKKEHLDICLSGWYLMLRGWLSGMREALERLSEDPEAEKQLAEIKGRSLSELIAFVEAFSKNVAPTLISALAYDCLGSEKLGDLMLEAARDKGRDAMMRLLCVFILLEISTLTALEVLRKDFGPKTVDGWVIPLITQRLYSFYSTRPLQPGVKSQLEDLLTELEFSALAKPKADRGQILRAIKEKVFREPISSKQ